MVVYERFEKRGVALVRASSDRGLYIERDGVKYEDAIDPAGLGRTYTETDEPIPTPSDVIE